MTSAVAELQQPEAKSLREMAAVVVALYLDRRWIRRRTDRTVLITPDRVKWTTVLEVILPKVDRVTLTYLPLPLLVKEKTLVTDFSVIDENGTCLATLTMAEERPVLAEILIAVAESTLETAGVLAAGVDPDVASALLRVVESEDLAREGITWLEEASRVTNPSGAAIRRAQQADALVGNETVRGLLTELRRTFPVLVPVANVPFARHVIAVQHEQVLTSGSITLPAGSAASYHAEISCPDGVVFISALSAHVIPRHLPNYPGRDQASHEGFWLLEPDNTSAPGIAVHATATRRDAELTVFHRRALRLAPGGLRFAVVFAAVATFGIFAIGASLRAWGAEPEQGEAAAALLIAVFSGYTAFLAVTASAPTAREVARPARLILGSIALLTAGAVAALGVKFPKATPPLVGAIHWGIRALIWCALAAASSAIVIWVLAKKSTW